MNNNITYRHVGRFLATTALVSLFSVTVGCLKSEITLVLKEDASGRLDVNYSISDTATSQLKTMTKWKERADSIMGETSAEPDSVLMNLFLDPDEAKIRAQLAKYEKNGITIETLKVQAKNAWRHVELRLAFKDLANAAKADFFAENGFSLVRRQDGNYAIHRDKASASSTSLDFLNDPENAKVINPILEGFKVVVRTDVPGKIIETNAGSKGPQTATWTFDHEKNPAAIAKLQTQEFDVVFEGKNLNLPQIKIVKKGEKTK